MWFSLLVAIALACIFLALGYFAERPFVLYGFTVGLFVLGIAFRVVIRHDLRKLVWLLTVAAAFLGLLCPSIILRLLSSDCRGFAISVVASAYSSRHSLDGVNVWYAHHTQYGPTISPVQELVYFRIVNTQPYTSTIEDYSVMLRTSMVGRIELQRMNLRFGQLLFGPGGDNSRPHGTIIILGNSAVGGPDIVSGHAMSVLNLNGMALDDLLANHPLQPHETVQGWAVFEVSPAYLKYLPHAWLVITIKDDAGEIFTCGLPPRPNRTSYQESTDLENAALKILPQTVDIRSFHRAFFGDFYPQ